MEKGRILITGASGQLGWHLARFLAGHGYRVTGTFHSRAASLAGIDFIPSDLEDESSVTRLAAGDYRVLIHAAALTKPDECERLPDLTTRINVDATRLLAERLPSDARLIYVSTDLVFDGVKGNYKEADPINPVNLYARSKAAAEEAILARPGSITVRMALLYGPGTPHPGGFVAWMRNLLEAGRPVPLFVDQFRTPIYVGDVARGVEKLIEGHPEHCVYHLGGGERTNRWDFGCQYVDVFGFDRALLQPVSTDSAGLVARGKDCSLDSSRFASEFGFQPAGVMEGLRRMKEGVY